MENDRDEMKMNRMDDGDDKCDICMMRMKNGYGRYRKVWAWDQWNG